LAGGSGNDRLIGENEFDTLQGGDGSDEYVFQDILDKPHRILNFEIGVDKILINKLGFNLDLTRGALAKENFVVGSAAQDRNDRFIYNPRTGDLSYDADGSRSDGAVTFATFFFERPSLSAANLKII
jgi:Ca2+-binding RTX toxin-like protein